MKKGPLLPRAPQDSLSPVSYLLSPVFTAT
jgi:hypothetical protein